MHVAYLNVETAVLVLRVVAVDEDVDADAEPRQSHDDEQLGEEDQLLARILQRKGTLF
jgi:hypothetical protein